MHVVYKITYIPHLDTDKPKFYVGSKMNYRGNYYGSVSSKRLFEFTKNQPLCEWWKNEIKENVDNFIFEILETHFEITPSKLLERELQFQLELQCADEDYFNQCYANKKFFSVKNTDETRKIKSEKTKAYWDSPAGKLKKQRLSERNSLVKSEEMKKRWEEENFRKRNIERFKAPKTLSTREKMSKARLSKFEPIEYRGEYYFGWRHLEKVTGVTKFLYKKYYANGYDPVINIKNKHPIKKPL